MLITWEKVGRFLAEPFPGWTSVFILIASISLAITGATLATSPPNNSSVAASPASDASIPHAGNVKAESSPAAPAPNLPPATPPQPSQVLSPTPEQKINLPTENGLAPVITKLPISEPVVFLGIDDGWTQTAEIQDWLSSHHLPFTLFLTDDAIKNNYGYYQGFQSHGMTIEDHTLHHPRLDRLDLAGQQAEICQTADKYAQIFGSRPTLLRPPYGAYNDLTRHVAAACGIKAIIMWDVVIDNGQIGYVKGLDHLEPGDIVLMHFKSYFVKDAELFMSEVQKNNLQIGKLEDWLK